MLDRAAKDALDPGEDRPAAGARTQFSRSDALKHLETGILEPAQESRVIDMTEGIHVTPGHHDGKL